MEGFRGRGIIFHIAPTQSNNPQVGHTKKKGTKIKRFRKKRLSSMVKWDKKKIISWRT